MPPKGAVQVDTTMQIDLEFDDGAIDSIDDLVFVNDFSVDAFDDIVEDLKEFSDCSLEVDGVMVGSDKGCFGISNNAENRAQSESIKPFVQKDELLKEIQEAGTIHGLNNYINKSMHVWESKTFNVAVAGNSGAGKSSLINALRGCKPSSPGAAKVGVKETTTEIEKYDYLETDKVTLWDLPGVGTKRFSRDTYLKDVGLAKFDIVIIVTATRLLENDLWLAEQAEMLGKRVFFVRTKIDMDLLNAERDDPETFHEATCLRTIRNDIKENVRKSVVCDLGERLYLVSSPERRKYDFKLLSERLHCLINTKAKDICEPLLSCLEEAMEAKRNKTKHSFNGKRAASVVFGFLPIPNLETALGTLTVRQIREVCLRKFNLDDDSLHRVSRELHIPVDALKDVHLLSYNIEQLHDDKRLYSEAEESRYSNFRRYSKYIVPIIGSALSALKCPRIIQDCLNTMCDVMADDEYHLVQLRLRLLERQLRPLNTHDI